MSLLSVPAVYDGNEVRLLETVTLEGPYRVVVTFLEPMPEPASDSDLERFWASFGAWQDERPVEDTLRVIREARSSKYAPPDL